MCDKYELISRHIKAMLLPVYKITYTVTNIRVITEIHPICTNLVHLGNALFGAHTTPTVHITTDSNSESRERLRLSQ